MLRILGSIMIIHIRIISIFSDEQFEDLLILSLETFETFERKEDHYHHKMVPLWQGLVFGCTL